MFVTKCLLTTLNTNTTYAISNALGQTDKVLHKLKIYPMSSVMYNCNIFESFNSFDRYGMDDTGYFTFIKLPTIVFH